MLVCGNFWDCKISSGRLELYCLDIYFVFNFWESRFLRLILRFDMDSESKQDRED